MNRLAFAAGAFGFLTLPALAFGKNEMADSAMLTNDLKAKRPHVASLTVRHVGAYVSTLTTITAEHLARVKPLHETKSEADIDAAFAAIEAAEPERSKESSEPRWHLTFADGSGKAILVVTTAAIAPRHGTIDGHDVVYRTNRLVHWLTEHYAPEEASTAR